MAVLMFLFSYVLLLEIMCFRVDLVEIFLTQTLGGGSSKYGFHQTSTFCRYVSISIQLSTESFLASIVDSLVRTQKERPQSKIQPF